MQLEKINKVNDIKKLNKEEKKVLATEIRTYLLDIVSKNGGHLASNLGVVELTIALESVFNLKKDKIVWDVGHQCYVHKILTGRKEQLRNIRQHNGISGFPKTNESKTDCFNTGHSSTSISAAMGIAKARDLQKKDYNVIAVIGDGALTGGMALEALNHVGCTKTKMIIILNDNDMSISKNTSGINTLLTKLRIRKNYRKSNKIGKEIILKLPVFGKRIVKSINKIKSSIKQLFLPGMYFEEIGIKYLGPVDGHNIEELEEILTKARHFDEPVLVHIITKKGKGYKYAEENPAKFHGIGSFDIETGELINKKSKNYSKVFGDKLVSLAKKNKKIVAITAAMKDGVGMTEFSKKFPNRFFDVGIAEQHALTFAAGLAKEGMIPIVSIYSSFYQRAYDQVIHDICAQKLPVIMCVDRAGIVGNDGETHQGLYDLGFFRIIPNIIIMAPRDFKELEIMIEKAIEFNRPVVIRYPRGGESKEKIDTRKPLVLGKAEIIKEGQDLTIIAIGKTVSQAYIISQELEENNISSQVINTRFLKPLDKKTIIKAVESTRRVVTIEDGSCLGGLETAVKELLAENNLENIQMLNYAYPDKFIEHGSVSELEKEYKMDNAKIIRDIKKYMKNNIKK